MLALLSVITLGFVLGMRHATDADHVVAVATFVSRERSIRASTGIGMIWGIGHMLTVSVVGGAITYFGLVVPERLGLSLELSVAVMLIALGLVNLRGIVRWIRGRPAKESAPEPDTEERMRGWLESRLGSTGPRHWLRPLIAGVVHGLAGSAALALLVLPMMQRPGWAVAYLLVFNLGTIAGMMMITKAIAWPCVKLCLHSAALGHRLSAMAGVLSLGFGVFLVYQIGFVQGLFIR